jgi:hypothetical protein
VDAVQVDHDRDLYDLIVSTPAGTTVVHTTARHPIWDDSSRAWTQAAQLAPGHRLHTLDGVPATVLTGHPGGHCW